MKRICKDNNAIKIYMLPAGKGDFFIIQYIDKMKEHFIFIDGGDKSAAYIYKAALTWINKENKCIDAIIFTHNDDDHICGALCAIMATETLPEIGRIYITLGKEIEKRFQIKALQEYPESEKKEYLHSKNVQHSSRQAVTLEEYFKEIGLEDRIEGCVCMGDRILVGDAEIKIISPGLKQLENYLNRWNQEIKDEKSGQHMSARKQNKLDLSCYVTQSVPKDTSVSNGSSIAFIFEHNGIKIAFLGDAYADVCVEGISKFYPLSDTLKVDAVKISHHGSAHNYSDKLYQLLLTEHYLLSTQGTTKHPSPVFLGKLFNQNKCARILCNGSWMRDYGFSEGDLARYLNKETPRIYQLEHKEYISQGLILCGKFPDE